jgi:kumamolisin
MGVSKKSPTHVDVPGTHFDVSRNAIRRDSVAPEARFEVTVRLRRQAISPQPLAGLGLGGGRHGATEEDLAAIAKFASTFGLSVVHTRKESGSVVLSGTSASFQRAFDVELHHYAYDNGTYRGRDGAVRVPVELRDVIVGVFGLDDRPFART